MVGDQTLPIENASGASLLQLQCAAEHCHEEGQYSSSLVLNKGIKSRFGTSLYCFRHVYRLSTHSELTSVMCRDRRSY